MAVATFLSTHPSVDAVHYPGLPSHPGHATMAAQLGGGGGEGGGGGGEGGGGVPMGFGGMLSFQPAGGKAAAVRTAANLRLFRRATRCGESTPSPHPTSEHSSPSIPLPKPRWYGVSHRTPSLHRARRLHHAG